MEGDLLAAQEERVAQIAVKAAAALLATADARAAALANTASEAAKVLAATTSQDLQYIKADISEIKNRLDNRYVNVDQFAPVKNIAYALVACMVPVIGTLLTLLFKK